MIDYVCYREAESERTVSMLMASWRGKRPGSSKRQEAVRPRGLIDNRTIDRLMDEGRMQKEAGQGYTYHWVHPRYILLSLAPRGRKPPCFFSRFEHVDILV